jgi:hypothetical protein
MNHPDEERDILYRLRKRHEVLTRGTFGTYAVAPEFVTYGCDAAGCGNVGYASDTVLCTRRGDDPEASALRLLCPDCHAEETGDCP